MNVTKDFLFNMKEDLENFVLLFTVKELVKVMQVVCIIVMMNILLKIVDVMALLIIRNVDQIRLDVVVVVCNAVLLQYSQAKLDI